MATFVKFPGTAGNYVSAPNINRLSTSAAHVQQTAGPWNASAPGASAVIRSADYAYFGDYSLKITTTGGDGRCLYNAVNTIPVQEGVEQSIGCWLYTEQSNRESFIFGQGYNGTSYTEAYGSGGTVVNLAPNTWTWIPGVVFTPSAGVDNIRWQVYYQEVGGADVAEDFYADAFSLVEGSDPAFVPSVNLVEDWDFRGLFAADPWAPGGGTLNFQRVFTCLPEPTAVDTGGWTININDSGAIGFLYPNGSDLRSEQSALYTNVDGVATDVRITFDVGALLATYYQDGVQIDDDAVLAGNGQISRANLNVGTYDDQALRMFTGSAYHLEIRDGINGPVVARFDAEDVPVAAQLPSP